MKSAIAAYLEFLRAGGRTPRTCDHAEWVLGRLRSFLRSQGVKDLRAVREEHLVAWKRELAQTIGRRGVALSSPSQHNYLSVARLFFRFLVRQGVLLVDPAAEVRMPSAETLPRTVLTRSQAERLMNSPSPYSQLGKRDRAILELLYGTGIRLGECVSFGRSDQLLESAVRRDLDKQTNSPGLSRI